MVLALTFLLQHWRVFDVQLVSKLAQALFQHGHDVISILGDDCQNHSSDANAVTQAGSRGGSKPLCQVPPPVLICFDD